jgi:ribosome biogenesis GTPase / thiamine phosphate phosphatase
LIFNKIDLYDEKTSKYQLELTNVYQSIGYRCFSISAEQNIGVEPLIKYMSGKKILISGHSGVGKSTLMNRISPKLDLKTLPISNFANKGVHTTTFAEMFDLGNHTFLIDTPGIKEFGLVEMEKYEISHFFPEMRVLIGQCKFNTCIHVNEPGCIIKQAVLEGNIAESRYKSYLSMLQDDDNRK